MLGLPLSPSPAWRRKWSERQDGWGWALGEEGSGRGAPGTRDYEANPADGAPTLGKVEPALAPLCRH